MKAEYPSLQPKEIRWAEERAFDHPWQGRVFALLICLTRAGELTWKEWNDALADTGSLGADASDEGERVGYFARWYTALTGLILAKGLLRESDIAMEMEAQRHANRADHHEHHSGARKPHSDALT